MRKAIWLSGLSLGLWAWIGGGSRVVAAEVVEFLTLERAVQMAVSQSADVRAAEARVDRAEAVAAFARAPLLPQVRAEASYTRVDPVPSMTLEIPVGPGRTLSKTVDLGTEETRRITLSVTQSVFSWWSDMHNRRAAALGVEVADIQRFKASEDAAMEAAKAFYTVLLLEQKRDWMATMLAQKSDHLEDVLSRRKSGLATELDKLRTEVGVESLRPEIDSVRGRAEVARVALRKAVGLPMTAEFVLRGGLEKAPAIANVTGDLAFLVKRALESSPVVRSLDKRIAALNEQGDAAAARDKPSLAVGAKYDYSNPFNLKDEWGHSTGLFATVSWPIFDGLAARSDAGMRYAERAELQQLAVSSRDGIYLAVKTALVDVQTADQRVQSRERGLKLAEKAYEVARVGYSSGSVTNADVLEADVELMKARLDRSDALYDAIASRLDLAHAQGLLVQSLNVSASFQSAKE